MGGRGWPPNKRLSARLIRSLTPGRELRVRRRGYCAVRRAQAFPAAQEDA